MPWQFTYITWIHLISAIVCLQLVFTVYNMQQIRGRAPFLLMMVLSAFWSLVLTFESAAPTIAEKAAWSQFEYIANMGIPLMFILFIMSYNLNQPTRFERYYFLLWIVPLITIILVFTNQMHHLIWTGFSWSPAGHNILIYHHGPLFFIAMAYSLGLIILGNVMLVWFILKTPGYYKSRGRILLSGSIFALLTGLVYTLGLSPVQGLDISPMGTLIAGLIFFRGIAKEQFFDIIPFSHQLMIEKLKDGVIVLDNRDFIMDISQVAMRDLKIEKRITGCKIDDVLPVLLAVVKETSTAQESRKEIYLEVPPAGWFEVTRYPLRGSGSKLFGSLLILHDINHRKSTEMQLRDQAEELTRLNMMKDQFYSLISHDLRNPFSTILGFSELLAESYDEFADSDRRQFARNILTASKSAFDLLENLLEWSMMQLKKFEFSPEELLLNRLVDESCDLLSSMAGRKKIELLNTVPYGQKVIADTNMTAAVLRNLISNGIKFTPEGGRITISSTMLANDLVEVAVDDNGIGMTAEMVAGLFSMHNMRSNRGTANEKGTGLGLLLTRDFIEMHKGSIHVTSEPGKGSRFVFTLPGKIIQDI